MRAYNATVGATDGNIIAAIITIHTVMNQLNAPRSVQGPLSIPLIWSAVHHQPAIANAKSSATRSHRARTAANAGASAPPRRVGSTAGAVMPSCRPGEIGRRESGLGFVLDAERVDARALGFGHREVGPDGMEHAVESNRLTGLDAERHDVLDLELDDITDVHAVLEPVVAHVDRGTLDTEHLADQGGQGRHRPSELSPEHLD